MLHPKLLPLHNLTIPLEKNGLKSAGQGHRGERKGLWFC